MFRHSYATWRWRWERAEGDQLHVVHACICMWCMHAYACGTCMHVLLRVRMDMLRVHTCMLRACMLRMCMLHVYDAVRGRVQHVHAMHTYVCSVQHVHAMHTYVCSVQHVTWHVHAQREVTHKGCSWDALSRPCMHAGRHNHQATCHLVCVAVAFPGSTLASGRAG